MFPNVIFGKLIICNLASKKKSYTYLYHNGSPFFLVHTSICQSQGCMVCLQHSHKHGHSQAQKCLVHNLRDEQQGK